VDALSVDALSVAGSRAMGHGAFVGMGSREELFMDQGSRAKDHGPGIFLTPLCLVSRISVLVDFFVRIGVMNVMP